MPRVGELRLLRWLNADVYTSSIQSMPTQERHPSEPTTAESPPDPVFCDEFVVPEDVIDGNGHVNNVTYVQWMQDIAIQHFTATGGVDLMHDLGGTWVARSHRIEYRKPAFAGDGIQVSTWVVNFRRVRSLRRCEFLRLSDGVLLARGETEWVFVNAESGRPCSIPEEIRRVFTLAPEGPES